MNLNTTKYYENFLRYAEMCAWQQENCNLGILPYSDTPWDDDLVKNVFLYDVCQRKYAGFTQLLLDIWYTPEIHPYAHKMSDERRTFVRKFDTLMWSHEEWFFVFFVHRLTGSGINYAKNPSGYHNSVLLEFYNCESVADMVEVVRNFKGPKFTSIGYQIAPFPKPEGDYQRGGDWFICEILPGLSKSFARWMRDGKQKKFRDMMGYLEQFNQDRGFRVFRFQYAAVLADIADFFPDLVDRDSPFFYGKNAIECLNYLAEKPPGVKDVEFLDAVMERVSEDTNSLPYNAEDVACDAIRWIENYINPKMDYSHLCLDSIWSSHTIEDHPFGRQKGMLELKLIESFNGHPHPSDDKIIKAAGLTPEQYRDELNSRI